MHFGFGACFQTNILFVRKRVKSKKKKKRAIPYRTDRFSKHDKMTMSNNFICYQAWTVGGVMKTYLNIFNRFLFLTLNSQPYNLIRFLVNIPWFRQVNGQHACTCSLVLVIISNKNLDSFLKFRLLCSCALSFLVFLLQAFEDNDNERVG